MPRVSVLLTTYNRPAFLRKAIESVLAQTYQDFELIVLDDNSDDVEQRKILFEEFQTHDGKVVVYSSDVKKEDRKKTTRYATLVNKGLEMAQGEFIAYLCDDDFFEPNKLELCVKYFDEHPEASVVYGQQKVMKLEPDGNLSPMPTPIRFAGKVLDQANCNVDHSSVVMRKSVYEKMGGWDDDPGWWGSADGVYWEKLNKAGYLFYPIDAVLDTHVYHDGSWTKDGRWEKDL